MSGQNSKKTMMITIFSILMILLSGCFMMPKEEEFIEPPLAEPSSVVYRTKEVVRDDIERTIQGTGVFIYVDQVNLRYTNNSGTIESVFVQVGDTVEEGELLMSLESESIQYSIVLQQFSVRRAELYYNRVKELQEENGGMEYELGMASIDLDIANIRLDKLKSDLEKQRIYAPITGVVTYMDPDLAPANYAAVNQRLISVADLSNVVLKYSGTNASYFKEGMTVQVRYKGVAYDGEVVEASYSDPRILIEIEELQGLEEYISGYTASVILVLERAEDALVVPKQAVHTFAGQAYVRVLEDGIKIEKDVTTGVESATHIEIKEGLDEGELVILD